MSFGSRGGGTRILGVGRGRLVASKHGKSKGAMNLAEGESS